MQREEKYEGGKDVSFKREARTSRLGRTAKADTSQA